MLGTILSAFHRDPVRVMIISPLSRWRMWASGRLSGLPEIAELVSGRTGIRNRLRRLHYFPSAPPLIQLPLPRHPPGAAPASFLECVHRGDTICATLQVHICPSQYIPLPKERSEEMCPKMFTLLNQNREQCPFYFLYSFQRFFSLMYFVFWIRKLFA